MVALCTRAMLLFAACLIVLFLGLWSFHTEQTRALASVGEQVNVVVAARPLTPWVPLAAEDLAIRQMPVRFTGPEHMAEVDQLIGRELVAPIPAGAAVPAFALYAGPVLQPGEVAWELRASGSLILDSSLQPGDRVSVLEVAAAEEAGGYGRSPA